MFMVTFCDKSRNHETSPQRLVFKFCHIILGGQMGVRGKGGGGGGTGTKHCTKISVSGQRSDQKKGTHLEPPVQKL